MASLGNVVLDMTRDIAPECMITIRVKGMKKWGLRLSIASIFFRLGAKIMNVGIQFNDAEEAD